MASSQSNCVQPQICRLHEKHMSKLIGTVVSIACQRQLCRPIKATAAVGKETAECLICKRGMSLVFATSARGGGGSSVCARRLRPHHLWRDGLGPLQAPQLCSAVWDAGTERNLRKAKMLFESIRHSHRALAGMVIGGGIAMGFPHPKVPAEIPSFGTWGSVSLLKGHQKGKKFVGRMSEYGSYSLNLRKPSDCGAARHGMLYTTGPWIPTV